MCELRRHRNNIVRFGANMEKINNTLIAVARVYENAIIIH